MSVSRLGLEQRHSDVAAPAASAVYDITLKQSMVLDNGLLC